MMTITTLNFKPVMLSNEIVINLNSSNHNRPVISGAELIQRLAFKTLRAQIRKDLIQAKSKTSIEEPHHVEKEDLYPPGSGLTYFIDGTRGAGKSTFLDFIYKTLSDHQPGDEEDKAVSTTPLLYLDPSRIESSEIVLLHILKHLRRLMENCPHRGQDWGKRHEHFRDLFKQMAGGLHLFVSNTESLKDLDAELFLDYGLDRAADSQRLRRILHQTIEQVCLAYKTHALLLAIDDADTKFANAIEVLECIRKYLDTPQMIVLVTGDMEMYSLLVQNHFQQDFARDNQGLSTDRKIQQSRMVAHLEEQYLLKLFPVQRRVQLRTLYTLAERKRKDSKQGTNNALPTFVVRKTVKEDTVPLLKAIEDLATASLRLRDRLDLDLFRDHILKLPIRSVLQLLSTYYQSSTSGISEREAAADALRAIALSSLYRHDIDVESIAEGNLHALINAAFDLCQLDGEPDTAIYLRPQSRDATVRNAYVSLAADVARLCEHDPTKAITYMVSTAGSNNILHLVAGKNNQKSRAREADSPSDESTLQRKVKQYLSVGRKDNALNWAWHATAALIGTRTTRGLQLHQGIIGVRTSDKDNAGTFDEQISIALEIGSRDSNSLYPAIAFSQSAVKRPNNTQRYLSIFNTLGLISNLLDLDTGDVTSLFEQTFKQLSKIESVQTVSLPNWDDLATRDDGNETDTSGIEHYTDVYMKMNLVNHIASWVEMSHRLKRQFHPSAVLLGKIWNRLYFSLDNISAAMRSSNQSEARSSKAMQLFAWALINACLVEEVEYHYREEKIIHGDKSKLLSEGKPELAGMALMRDNPRTSGNGVIEKFQTPVQSDHQIRLDITPNMAPLAFMIASCPLVLGLIKNNTETREFIAILNTKLTKVRGEYKIPPEVLCTPEVWDCIGRTTISG